MFTGIIQGLGAITQLAAHGAERRFRIKPQFHMENVADGESIAVNGVCLTVETHSEAEFTAYASAETLQASTLGNLRHGDNVNLERALKLGDRLGGHIISGHVDCVAKVATMQKGGESLKIGIAFPARFSPQVVRKGSVALDGMSLTVNECGQGTLEINIIPESQKTTNIATWRLGCEINLETDIIGKYAQRMLLPWQGLDRRFLAENGFI